MSYQTEALVTCSEVNKDTTQALLGLGDEIGEFCKQVKNNRAQGHKLNLLNLKEELGDILWYSAMHCELVGLDVDDLIEKANTDLPVIVDYAELAVYLLAAVSDAANCGSVYGIVRGIVKGAELLDTSIEEVKEDNITKLRRRYGVKFFPYKSRLRLERLDHTWIPLLEDLVETDYFGEHFLLINNRSDLEILTEAGLAYQSARGGVYATEEFKDRYDEIIKELEDGVFSN